MVKPKSLRAVEKDELDHYVFPERLFFFAKAKAPFTDHASTVPESKASTFKSFEKMNTPSNPIPQ